MNSSAEHSSTLRTAYLLTAVTTFHFIVYRKSAERACTHYQQALFRKHPTTSMLFNNTFTKMSRSCFRTSSAHTALSTLPFVNAKGVFSKMPQEEQPLPMLQKTQTKQVLRRCQLIVWDECTVAHKGSLEALKDIRGYISPMGSVSLLLSGDFRQILPLIPKGTRSNAVMDVTSLTLTTNMRAQLFSDKVSGDFSKKLLTVGDGTAPSSAAGEKDSSRLGTPVGTADNLTTAVFPDLHINYQNLNWLCESVVLALKSTFVAKLNENLLRSLLGNFHTYKSVETVVDQEEAVNFLREFLNSLDPSGLPPHQLHLKIGALAILLRNLESPRLCNRMWFVVKNVLPHVIEVTILMVCGIRDSVFIPKISLTPSDKQCLFSLALTSVPSSTLFCHDHQQIPRPNTNNNRPPFRPTSRTSNHTSDGQESDVKKSFSRSPRKSKRRMSSTVRYCILMEITAFNF
uniref:ATP-dependent DNA helicase n=1 Tax=Octopus bimaculoides TaxID=37653 RepID=A0A0L8GMG3_OCTBM